MLRGDGTSYYEADSHEQPLRDMTLGELLDARAGELSDQEALIYSTYQDEGIDVRWTYRELKEKVDLVARGLMAMGIARGEKVALWATNLPEWVLMEFALSKIGAVLVTVNVNYQPPEMEYLLTQSNVSSLFLMEGFRDTDYLDTINELAPELATSQPGDLRCGRLPDLKKVVFIGDQVPPGMLNFNQLYEMAEQVSVEELARRQAEVSPHDPVQIQYTSGTTGFPKGATLSHSNILNNAFFLADRFGIKPGKRYLSGMPLFHTGGCVCHALTSVAGGGTMIELTYFDPLKMMQALQNERATHYLGVPTMCIAIMQHPEFPKFDFSSLEVMMSGGSPVPIEVAREVEEKWGCKVLVIYGLTESSPVITFAKADEPLELRVETVGSPLPYMEVKIADPETGKPVPLGEYGELCCRGYNVMLGYYQMPDKTAETIDEEGWLHTGDLGVMRETGHCNIVGRIKDMIIRGGENIYGREIEELLITHPKILDVYIVGVPDKKWGEEVAAFVNLHPGEQMDLEELRAYCEGKLARHKRPKHLMLVDEFPLTGSGKVQKFKLREMFVKEKGLQDVDNIKYA
jgi:fatty-acyl-CoA synthase